MSHIEHLPTGIDPMSVVVSTAAIMDKMDSISTDIYRDVKDYKDDFWRTGVIFIYY